MAGTAVQAVAGLVASIVLARLVGPEGFGRFAVALATVGLTLNILSLRLSILITRATTQELAGHHGSLYFTALFTETLLAGCVSLVWLSLSGLWDIWTLLLVLSQCLAHWVGCNKAFYERAMAYAQLAMVETAAVLGGNAAAVFLALGGAGEAALYLRELIIGGFLFVTLGTCGALTFRPLRRISIAELSLLVREARSVWLDGVLEGGFQRLTTLAASLVSTDRETGYFFMAQSLAMRPHQLLAPLTTRVASNWYRTMPTGEERRRGRDQLLLLTGGLLVLCAVLMIWLADPLVPAVLGTQWQGAVPVLRAMAGIVVFLTLFEVLRIYAFVVRRERYVLMARIAQYTALAGFAVLPAATSGVVTLGIAVSAAFTVAFFVLWFTMNRHPRA